MSWYWYVIIILVLAFYLRTFWIFNLSIVGKIEWYEILLTILPFGILMLYIIEKMKEKRKKKEVE